MSPSLFRISPLSLLAAGFLALSGGAAQAADPPAPADVLSKLHQSNTHEIAMGKLAQKNGQSADVKKYGKMLVKDHGAADKKVVAFAKKEKLELPTTTDMKADHMDMGTGAAFDSKFAEEMVEDHKKDIAEVTSARDSTTDDKLKKLLSDLLPTLEKHRDTAQKLVDGQKK